jgi:hypothetical protein
MALVLALYLEFKNFAFVRGSETPAVLKTYTDSTVVTQLQ